MIPVNNLSLPKKERELLKKFRKLDDQQQKTLQEFAAFLQTRGESAETEKEKITEPLDIPRPAEESVVKAIKRLTATYPMLEKERILNQTSSLMAQHIMQGRAAPDVIDELEDIFKTHYTELSESND